MTNASGNAPAWLFAFVDLAFLLLLAMTQLGGKPNAPELGELLMPRIGGESPADLASGAADAWQVRVHPRDDSSLPPFELVSPEQEGVRVGAFELHTRLEELRGRSAGRPLLAPDAESRSQDLLDAVALVEETWPSRRRATVERVLAAP